MNASRHTQSYGRVNFGSERQARIAEIVRNQGCARVDELAAHFAVSTQTIRKDINVMCAQGLLRRVHGGVELAMQNAGHYALRRVLNLSAKQRIGTVAADMIPDGSIIAVSIGTTPELVVTSLAARQGLKVFTNNLHVAMAVHHFDDAEVTIPGGTLRDTQADIVGVAAVNFFDSYHFDVGVFGVAAVDETGGLRDLFEEDVQSREAIGRNSDTRVLVLDVSKFGRPAHVRGGHITDVDHVVCDARPPKDICDMLQDAQVSLTICDEVGL